MPFEQRYCWIGRCDKCGTYYDDDVEYVRHFADIESLKSEAKDSDWLVTNEGMILCPLCLDDTPSLELLSLRYKAGRKL